MTTRNSTGASRAITQFPALVTKAEMAEGERAAQSWGFVRRSASAALTRTSEQLIEGIRDLSQAKVAFELVEEITNYLKWRETETDMLKSARARLLFALRTVYPTVTPRRTRKQTKGAHHG